MATMGFLAFIGRLLFACIFLLTAYLEASEFGYDGGPAAKSLEPNFNLFVKKVSTYTGMAVPHIQMKTIIVATVCLRAFGAGLFIMGSSFGAFLLLIYLMFITHVLYDFDNYEKGSLQYVQLHTQYYQNVAMYGALAFFAALKRH